MPGRLLQARVVQDGFVLPGGAATKAAHVVAGCVHVTLCGRAQDVREQLLGSLTRKSRSQLHPSTYNVQQVPVDMQTLLVVRYAPPPQILPAHTDNEWNDASTVMKSGRILPILAIRLDYLPNNNRTADDIAKKSQRYFLYQFSVHQYSNCFQKKIMDTVNSDQTHTVTASTLAEYL